jgi:YHS domain-containing protein
MKSVRKKTGTPCYVCRMPVTGRKLNRTLEKRGKTLSFCCEKCKQIYLDGG